MVRTGGRARSAHAAGADARRTRLGPRLPESRWWAPSSCATATVVGEGWHEGPGTAHAEIMALAPGRRPRPRRHRLLHARALRPLRPHAAVHTRVDRCRRGARRRRHRGSEPRRRTRPGSHELRAAGVEVAARALSGARSRRLNEAFERHVATGLPFVTLKMAASLDGKTAAADGTSQWITGEAARADVQRLRAGADAIVVGARTAIADDPALTVRDPRFADGPSAPARRRGRRRSRARRPGALFDGAAPTLVATTAAAPEARMRAWAAAGAEVLTLDGIPRAACPLPALLHALGQARRAGRARRGRRHARVELRARRPRRQDRAATSRPGSSGRTAAPGVLGGDGFAPDRARRCALDFDGDRAGRRRPEVEAYVHRDR